MPKSILDIDIHDEKFKKFVEVFEQFKVDADKLNDVWKTFDVDTKKPRASVEALDKAIGRAHGSSEKMAKTWAAVSGHIGESGKRLDKFERGLKSVERGLERVAGFGLKFGKFALAAGGIGLFGGLFGIDELANSAMSQQKSARGLGMKIGQVQAFKTYMQPYLSNPQGTLQAIMNARRTPEGMAALAAMGFSPAQYDNPNLNRMKFAEDVIERARTLYLHERKNSPNVPIEAILKALKVQSLGLNLEDVRRLANAPQSELVASMRRADIAARQDQLSNKTATAWTNLKVQLDQAGIAIRNDLINHLVKLAPAISVLSKKVEGFINTFITTKSFNTLIKTFSTDIEDVATYLGSAHFKQSVVTFANSVDTLALETLKLSKVLGGFAEDAAKHKDAVKATVYGAAALWAGSKLYKTGKWIGSLFGDGGKAAATVADDSAGVVDAAGATGLGLLSTAGLAIGGLLYSPSLGNGDLPLPKGAFGRYYKNSASWRKHNNWGDIDPILNGKRYYEAFPSVAAGIQAIAKTVAGYHLDTIRSIMSKYEGRNAPHLASNVNAVSHWMHDKPDQRLNISNVNTLSRLVTGIVETEQHHRRDYQQLYQTVREAIIDGLKSGGGVKPTHTVATAMHAARF